MFWRVLRLRGRLSSLLLPYQLLQLVFEDSHFSFGPLPSFLHLAFQPQPKRLCSSTSFAVAGFAICLEFADALICTSAFRVFLLTFLSLASVERMKTLSVRLCKSAFNLSNMAERSHREGWLSTFPAAAVAGSPPLLHHWS